MEQYAIERMNTAFDQCQKILDAGTPSNIIAFKVLNRRIKKYHLYRDAALVLNPGLVNSTTPYHGKSLKANTYQSVYKVCEQKIHEKINHATQQLGLHSITLPPPEANVTQPASAIAPNTSPEIVSEEAVAVESVELVVPDVDEMADMSDDVVEMEAIDDMEFGHDDAEEIQVAELVEPAADEMDDMMAMEDDAFDDVGSEDDFSGEDDSFADDGDYLKEILSQVTGDRAKILREYGREPEYMDDEDYDLVRAKTWGFESDTGTCSLYIFSGNKMTSEKQARECPY